MNQMKSALEENFDKEIECVDCHDNFVFTAGEQSFFSSKGFSEPKRCKPCREKKREAKDKK